MSIGFHFSNEICQMSMILQLKNIPWGREILKLFTTLKVNFKFLTSRNYFGYQRENAKYHVFPLELSFQKMYSCQVIRKLLDYGPWWMSEEVKVLMGGGGGGGGRGGIEDGCVSKYHGKLCYRSSPPDHHHALPAKNLHDHCWCHHHHHHYHHHCHNHCGIIIIMSLYMTLEMVGRAYLILNDHNYF